MVWIWVGLDIYFSTTDDVTKNALGVYRKYVEQKLALRLEGDHVIFRGDLRHHKDTRTNFTISNTSGAMGSPKVPQKERKKERI